ncbi:MAG: fibronectin type III domain-containing protein [Candidatus Hodarchaeota archaeon]
MKRRGILRFSPFILVISFFSVVITPREIQITGWVMNDNDSSQEVPDPPGNLNGTMHEKGVKLEWEAPLNDGGANVTEYRIYRSQTSGWCGTHTLGDTYLGNTTKRSFVDSTEFENGYTYWYVVTAVNSKGESEFSEEVSVFFQAEKTTSWNMSLLIASIIAIVVIKRKKSS